MVALAAFIFLLITVGFWLPLLAVLFGWALVAIIWLLPIAVGFGIWAGNDYSDGAAVAAVIVTVGLYFVLSHMFKD